MAAQTTSKQETKQGFYHLSLMLFKHVFSFAKIENLPWWIKTAKNVSNYQISIGKLLSEEHIDARTTLEAWNGGNDFGICRWRFINKFSVFNEMKIYSVDQIGDEIKWLLVISCYLRSVYGQTYNFRSLKGRNAGGISKWCYLSKFSF